MRSSMPKVKWTKQDLLALQQADRRCIACRSNPHKADCPDIMALFSGLIESGVFRCIECGGRRSRGGTRGEAARAAGWTRRRLASGLSGPRSACGRAAAVAASDALRSPRRARAPRPASSHSASRAASARPAERHAVRPHRRRQRQVDRPDQTDDASGPTESCRSRPHGTFSARGATTDSPGPATALTQETALFHPLSAPTQPAGVHVSAWNRATRSARSLMITSTP
jgi:hypothetical protein